MIDQVGARSSREKDARPGVSRLRALCPRTVAVMATESTSAADARIRFDRRADNKGCSGVARTAGVPVSLAVAEERDPKGLYKKARAGEIKNFTGIDDPYEAPESPEIHLHTDKMTIDEEVQIILDHLTDNGFIVPPHADEVAAL